MPNIMLEYQARCNNFLESYFKSLLANSNTQASSFSYTKLLEGMHYAVTNGGKRIRPLLVYAATKAANPNINANDIDHTAAAIECIHCYSLVHDDLPVMDDDDLRRGKPTCHKKYDEATAILIGDALQAEAFKIISLLEHSAEVKIKLLNTISSAASANGLVGGQALDLSATDNTISLENLQTIHQLKTGALISASVQAGAILAGANAQTYEALTNFSQAIGLAFQVQDDIIDLESSTSTLGKQQGADEALNKSTYPKLMGMNEAKVFLNSLLKEADECLDLLGDNAEFLRTIALFITQRNF